MKRIAGIIILAVAVLWLTPGRSARGATVTLDASEDTYLEINYYYIPEDTGTHGNEQTLNVWREHWYSG